MKKHVLLLCCLSILGSLVAQEIPSSLEAKVIQWRHEIHQNPELSNREFKTAEKVAAHLKALGMEVQTGIAHTGVIGLLKGKRAEKCWPCVQTWTAFLLPKTITCPTSLL